MAELLLDTNILSFILRGSTDAERYAKHLNGNSFHVAFMTVAEMDRWAIERNWGQQRRMDFERLLSVVVVHPYSRDLGQAWAQVMVVGRRAGRSIGIADAWIAATALIDDLPLVTDDLGDFEAVPGLRIIHEPRPV